MKTSSIIRTACIIAAFSAIALPGCSAPHSQKVRTEARDRFDRAGAQIAYDQARQNFNSGQFEPALTNIDRAIVRFPKEASFFLLRGRILNEMKRTDEARECFARSIELDPRKPEPHYFLGIVYQRWRQMDDALAQYSKAAELDPTKLHYVCAEVEVMTAMGKYEEADARIAAVSTRFEYSAVIDRLKADVAKTRGDTAVCAELLERASVREEANPEVMVELAFARFSSNDWIGVLATLDSPELKRPDPKAEDKKPLVARADLVRLRARSLLMLGRATEARDALLPIRMEPDTDGRTLLLLGNAAWRASDWTCLRQCGESLILSHPTLADGYLFVGGANYAAGDLAASQANFEQAVARDPERATSRRLLEETSRRIAQNNGADGPRADSTPAAAGIVRTEAP